MRSKRSSAAERWAQCTLGLSLMLAGCTDRSAGAEGCLERFWIRPSDPRATVELVGSWNDFARPGLMLSARSDGWFQGTQTLAPGPVRYAFIVDGRWTRDRTEPLEETANGEAVTRRDVVDCAAPQLTLANVRVDANALRLSAILRGARDGTPFTTLTLTDDATGAATPIPFDPTTGGAVEIAIPVPFAKRFAFRVRATDTLGRSAEGRSFVWTDGHTDADRIGYQVLPDRFRGPAGAALMNPSPLAVRAGGTLDGITAELRRGTFEALAVDTLWLMPIVQNTTNAFDIGDGAKGTGYHGYWATSPSAVDARLGTDDDLRALLDEAHARGIRVLLDVVPNHVHQEHPYWLTHQADGWFHGDPAACICGSRACPWETAIERCAFAPYMPDLDWSHPDAAETMTADTVAWLERFPFDGLRIDAVPMMPRGASRALVKRARDRVGQGSADLMALGEVFTGNRECAFFLRSSGTSVTTC